MSETSTTSVTLSGRVRRVIHRSAEGWAALDVEFSDGRRATVVGQLPRCFPGESLRATGAYEDHPRFGRRFAVTTCEVDSPATEDGLVEVLADMISGFGEKTARKFVRAHGGVERTLAVLNGEPPSEDEGEDLRYVVVEWHEQFASRSTDVALASLGLTPSLRSKLAQRYGSEAPALVRADPYRLCREVDGVGFRTADEVARKVGVPVDSAERLYAALCHVVTEEAEARGHVWSERGELDRMLAVATDRWWTKEEVDAALERAARKGKVVVSERSERGNVAHAGLAGDEEAVGRFVLDRVSRPSDGTYIDYVSMEDLSTEQRISVYEACRRHFYVVTGGPGVGKTTTTKAIVYTWANYSEMRYALVAPTGRAARRLAEATSCETSTIHRLLGWDPRSGGYIHNLSNRLKLDACLVDESSMVDVRLLRALCDALPDRCSLVLVGDADQLPPVGPGAPFRDLVGSVPLAVSRLTKVYRQAERSRIVSGSREILSGSLPTFSEVGDRTDGGLYFVEEGDEEKLRDLVVRIVSEVAPEEFGVKPEDVQVVSPRRKGTVGVSDLNLALQGRLNHRKLSATSGAAASTCRGDFLEIGRGETTREFRVGDRVMQVKNDYERGVVNGELGVVTTLGSVVDEPGSVLWADFDGKVVAYDRESVRDLDLAYCSTVHKVQGAEFPVVVVVVHSSHGWNLDRSLVYTAVTRARRACVVVGERKALGRACRNGRSGERRTTLPGLMRKTFDGKG